MWELDHKQSREPKGWWFKLWCWRRLLRVPWTARRQNQSILKEINPENSLEGLMLKLKLQYFGHLKWRTDIGKDPMLGKNEGRRRRGWQKWDGWMASLTWWTMNLSKLRKLVIEGKPGILQSMRSQRVGHDWTTEQNWTPLLLSLTLTSQIPIVWLTDGKTSLGSAEIILASSVGPQPWLPPLIPTT